MAPSAIRSASAVSFPVAPPKSLAVSSTKSVDSAQDALNAAIGRFIARNPRSAELHKIAAKTMPGGNTRTLLYTYPFPVSMKSGKEYQVLSEDGHIYTDLVGELTAAVFGHSHPAIIGSIVKTLDDVGMNLGATIAQEHIHASAMCDRFDIEAIRFTNCGTEANMHALAGARAYTGKRKVVVFSGGYHGGVFIFSGGVPAPNTIDREDFIIARYNDVESAQEAIGRNGVAAVLVEGMQGGAGAIPGTPNFLEAIQEAANEAGVLFILDEVMTSRVHPGGLAALRGLRPDMKTFGKYLGGGLAFGAFGGRAEIMAIFDPRASGSACEELNSMGDRLRHHLAEVTRGTKMCFTGIGAVMASHFTDNGLQSLDRETPENQVLKELFWLEMMEDGFWITKRGSIALILGTSQEEMDRFVQCVAAFLERHTTLVQVE